MGRVFAVRQASRKLLAKVERSPDDPRADSWRSRLAEYDQFLADIEEGKLGNAGPVGVSINVPSGG